MGGCDKLGGGLERLTVHSKKLLHSPSSFKFSWGLPIIIVLWVDLRVEHIRVDFVVDECDDEILPASVSLILFSISNCGLPLPPGT